MEIDSKIDHYNSLNVKAKPIETLFKIKLLINAQILFILLEKGLTILHVKPFSIRAYMVCL